MRQRRFRAGLASTFCLLLLALAACSGGNTPPPDDNHGPGPGPGPTTKFTLMGTVTNPTGQPLPGVRLLLGQRTDTTGAGGAFSFDEVQEGGYTLSLQAPDGAFDCRSIVVAQAQTNLELILPSPLPGLRVTEVQPLLNSTGLSLGSSFRFTTTGPLDPASVQPSDFRVTPSLDFSVAVAGDAITIQPVLQLGAGAHITVEVTGDIRGSDGAPLSKPVRWSFRTAGADLAPPRLLGTSPADGATGVPVNQTLRLEFNERLAHPSGIGVSAVPAAAVNAALDATGRTLLLQPVTSWHPATSYSITVTGVEDVAGNLLSSPVVLDFTTGTQSLLTHNGQADWNRITNAIVFSSDRGGSSGFDIWRIGPDGTGLVQLTHLPGDELHPTLSADGSRLAFQRRAANGRWDIYVASVSGDAVSEPVPVTPLEFNDSEPQFSRTLSNLLVFTSDRGIRTGLYSMNEDGSLPAELDSTFGLSSSEPSANPLLDGQYLFSAVTGERRDVWRKSVSVIDGSTVNTNLTEGRASDDYSPAWGSDASFVVFISDLSGAPNLWMAEANGDFPRQVTGFTDPVDDPFPSPIAGDSSCVLTYLRPDGGSDLVIVSLVSGAILRNLTSPDGPQP